MRGSIIKPTESELYRRAGGSIGARGDDPVTPARGRNGKDRIRFDVDKWRGFVQFRGMRRNLIFTFLLSFGMSLANCEKLSRAVAAAQAGARAAAERRLARAETKLANTIKRRLNDLIPDSELHASKAWVDPFFGFQGRWEINDRHYVVGRGDIGGFGVSSELAWNAYAALGTVVNEKTSVELGYRYY